MNRLRTGLVMIIISLLGIFVLISGPIGAQDDDFTYNNPIITHLVAVGLVTSINHEAVVNGVDTTINWVYADVSQVIVCLTMHNLDYSTTGPDQIPAKEKLRVVSPEGDEFQLSAADATISNAPEGRFNLTVVTYFYPQATMLPPLAPGETHENYFVDLGPDLPETLNLQLKLDIETNASPGTWMVPLPGEPAELMLPVMTALHHGITLNPQTTVRVNGQDVTLKRLTVAPSRTIAEVCYEIPDTEDWQPVARLYLDEQYILSLAHSNRPTQAPTAEDYSRCFEIPFDIVHHSSTPTVDFTVEFLFLPTPNPREYWENVRDALAQDGIELELYPSRGVDYKLAIRVN